MRGIFIKKYLPIIYKLNGRSFIQSGLPYVSIVSNRTISIPAIQHNVDTNLFILRKNMAVHYRKTNEDYIRNILNSSNVYTIFEVLSDRFENGVFLNSRNGYLLMQKFIENEDPFATFGIFNQLLKNDQVDENVIGLTLKACYRIGNSVAFDPNLLNPADANKEQKMRVSFLTNCTSTENLRQEIGNIAVNMFIKLPEPINHNIRILGYAIGSRVELLKKTIESNGKIFYNDTIDICKRILENKNEHNINDFLQSIEASHICKGSLNDEINKIVANCNFENEQSASIENLSQDIHMKECEQKDDETPYNINIEELKRKAENIWFFEIKEKLDLQIFKKCTHYPVRWHGKKKTLKSVEDTYIPPEV